jgi:hypothetical protein
MAHSWRKYLLKADVDQDNARKAANRRRLRGKLCQRADFQIAETGSGGGL